MLKRSLVPTTLVEQSERNPIEIAPLRPLGFSSFGTFLKIVGFAFYCLWAIYVRRMPQAEFAPRVRIFIEGLGGLWIKAGQILSLRTDLLSREMADELAMLQGRVIGFPPEVSIRMIEDSLGRPLSDVFDVFEEHPFAAASIAQVHRAHLRHERAWVVVKVQRPDIAAIFRRDLKIISALVGLAKRIPSISYITWDGLIREVRYIMEEETDYRYEAENLRRMRKILRPHRIYVPKMFRRYATRHVLVMEMISGTLMSDYLNVSRADPARAAAWREENNVDSEKVGARLLRSLYRQMFEDNLFHGDLHPGNVILLRNSRFALIDLGTIGSLERRFLRLYQQQTQAWAERDYGKSFDYYLLLADSIPIFDVGEFKADAVAMVRAWESRTHLRSLSYFEKSITGGIGTELAQLASKYRINLSWQFLRVSRALGTMDASLVVLLGNTNPNKILRKYFREMRRRRLKELISGDALKSAAETLGDLRGIAGLTAERLRQAAVRFESVRSTASYLAGALFGAVRFALFAGGLVLLYNFLRDHHSWLIAPVHERIGGFRAVDTMVPPLPYEFGPFGLLALLIAYALAGRVKRRIEARTLRLPDGRLDR